jgi:hypothetical protein
MADCTTISSSSPFVGSGPLMGYVNTILVYLDEKPADTADATAQLQATHQTAIYQDSNRAYLLPFSDIPERRVSEAITKEMSEGDIVLGQKNGTQAVTIVADSCTVRTLHANFKSSKVAWMYQFTNKDYIIGKDGVADETIAPIKVRIASTINEGGPADPWEITLSVTLLEDYYDRIRNLKLTWEVTDLTPTESVTLQIVSSSTSSVTVRALTCNICDATDMTPANFKVKTSAGVDEPITAPTQNGNEYTLPATTSYAAGDHLAYYELPSVTSEKYITNESAFTTV